MNDVALLAASPLARAQQTAEILAAAYGIQAFKTVAALSPGQPPAALARWVADARKESVVVVGHEPHLSSAVSWLLTGADRPILELKKGGACLLDLPRDAGAGSATLLWALWPSQLRDLGD
jgi:phosphohistidine phosphatase